MRFLRRHPSAKQINEMWKGKGAEGVKGMGYKVLMMKNKNKDKNKDKDKDKDKNKDKEKDKDKNKKNKKNKNKNKKNKNNNKKNKKNKNKNNNINSNGCCSSHYPVQVGNAGRAYYRTPDDRIYLQHPELQVLLCHLHMYRYLFLCERILFRLFEWFIIGYMMFVHGTLNKAYASKQITPEIMHIMYVSPF